MSGFHEDVVLMPPILLLYSEVKRTPYTKKVFCVCLNMTLSCALSKMKKSSPLLACSLVQRRRESSPPSMAITNHTQYTHVPTCYQWKKQKLLATREKLDWRISMVFRYIIYWRQKARQPLERWIQMRRLQKDVPSLRIWFQILLLGSKGVHPCPYC